MRRLGVQHSLRLNNHYKKVRQKHEKLLARYKKVSSSLDTKKLFIDIHDFDIMEAISSRLPPPSDEEDEEELSTDEIHTSLPVTAP